ncbi:helix-turn-helix transcriptional regulator [Devosia psychrophila]|uniref:Transcriptional regulator, AlpA family n=1 Tax=Devosia psychrophila TaxID=728005 RepID=A0A0F5PY42_9HYPH|nr:helix-turn-helix domain-containing protein [Devosia psychrophila]KKC32749.1 hypothetical protein WH91_12550 [Devosia psychrophila]SFC51274.1 transcriptional regulator, AlpA family [Devosia psychrophila]
MNSSIPIQFLNVNDAAARLGVSASWLNKLRVRGGGPKFIKLGRRVIYGEVELIEWAAHNRHSSTSD